MAKKRKCLACGSIYEYCPNCNNSTLYPSWKVEFDTIACKELFNVLSGYNMGIFDKEKVKSVIDKHNITDFSKYDKNIAKQLKDIVKLTSKTESTSLKKNDNSEKK